MVPDPNRKQREIEDVSAFIAKFHSVKPYDGPAAITSPFSELTPTEISEKKSNNNNHTGGINFSSVKKMTVAELKEELKKLKVEISGKILKKDLQELLLSHLGAASSSDENNNNTSPVPSKRQKIDVTATKQLTDAQLLAYFIEYNGTKIAHLLIYLLNLWRANPTARVIIFAQSTPFLNQINESLAAYNILSAIVEGNVYKRTKALKNYKTPDSEIKVILLSTKSTASGSNLFKASHVFFMDPVEGNPKEVQAIEAQAIGRAHRQGQINNISVVRFICRGTNEHKLYTTNTA